MYFYVKPDFTNPNLHFAIYTNSPDGKHFYERPVTTFLDFYTYLYILNI